MNTPHPEKLHVSAFRTLRDLQSGQQGTSSVTSLSIGKEAETTPTGDPASSSSSFGSFNDPSYAQAAALIVDIKGLGNHFRECEDDADVAATVVLDINVMEDLRFERTPQDISEVIALALLTGHILLRTAGVSSSGAFVKVQPNSLMELDQKDGGRLLVSARWPDLLPSVLKMAHSLRQTWKGSTEDFSKLRDVIDTLVTKDRRRNIVLMGRTGSGKSYTGNWLLRPVCDDDSLTFMESESGSMTSFVENLPKKGTFCVWDTPGLDDAYGRDNRYLDDIEKSILEMGTVSVVILCFSNIERIERSLQQQIASYSKIIGPELSSGMMLFTNRQSRGVTKIQKRNLMSAMRKEGGFVVEEKQIFDMGPQAPTMDTNLCDARQMLLKMSSKPGMRMSYMDRLQQGLVQIQSLNSASARGSAEEILVKMSTELLWRKFGDTYRSRVLKIQSRTGRVVVLNDRCRYLVDGQKLIIEHVLELPEAAMTKFEQRSVFMMGLGSRNQPMLQIIELVRKHRLVFMEMPMDRRLEHGGLLRKVLKIRYRLWNVRDALAEDVKQEIQKAVGEKADTSVSGFPGLTLS